MTTIAFNEGSAFSLSPKRIGWLLACTSPINVKKGKQLFLFCLTDKEKEIALDYRDECLKVYGVGDYPLGEE